jgi:predicted HicB family RNase H-like nuclease
MIQTLNYKGYVGSIEASVEDNCLHGRVLHVDAILSYEGNTLQELKADFEQMLDDYIEDCKQQGVPAIKSYSGVFNVRISPETHKALAHKAASEGVKLNQLVSNALTMCSK